MLKLRTEHEMLLIRVGHHLWKSWKRQEWPQEAVLAALETVWEAKRMVRLLLRKATL